MADNAGSESVPQDGTEPVLDTEAQRATPHDDAPNDPPVLVIEPGPPVYDETVAAPTVVAAEVPEPRAEPDGPLLPYGPDAPATELVASEAAPPWPTLVDLSPPEAGLGPDAPPVPAAPARRRRRGRVVVALLVVLAVLGLGVGGGVAVVRLGDRHP